MDLIFKVVRILSIPLAVIAAIGAALSVYHAEYWDAVLCALLSASFIYDLHIFKVRDQ